MTTSAVQGKNVSGRPWKAPKTATKRTQGKQLLSKSWNDRLAERAKQENIKKLEREIKAEHEEELQRVKEINVQRKAIEADKARIAAAAEKMSAKRLQRLKKKLGRTKKVNA